MKKRYADAVQIVHKIKSSSGSIGAKSLQDTAVSLQKALEDEKEEEIVLLQSRFSESLKKNCWRNLNNQRKTRSRCELEKGDSQCKLRFW